MEAGVVEEGGAGEGKGEGGWSGRENRDGALELNGRMNS